jgi:cysteine desulfurase family protein
MIYADNSATSGYIPQNVREAVNSYLLAPGNPGHSACKSSVNAARQVFLARKKIANFFGGNDPSQVIFTSGVTESLNLLIHSWIGEGDEVITSIYEHNSVLRPLYGQKANLVITDGSLEQIEKAITPKTKAIIINHVSNVTGQVQDITAIAQLAKEKNVLFLVDTAQSAGILDVKMQEGISALCFTGHKGLHGLQGSGGLILAKGLDVTPLKTGGTGNHSFEMDMPHILPDYLEAGTQNVCGILSMAAGIDWIKQTGRQNIEEHVTHLAKHFMQGLIDVPNVKIYGPETGNSPGIVSLNIEGKDDAAIGYLLQEKYGIETRAGAHCAPLVHRHYQSEGMVRFSFGMQNTIEEVNACIAAIKELASD